jgi:hypothetical protein
MAGVSVALAGDVDADGYADFNIGAWLNDEGGQHAGVAFFVRGPAPTGGSPAVADAKPVGEDGGDEADYSTTNAGDVNGDGRADFLVGALGDDGLGAAYLFYWTVSGTHDLSTADFKLVLDRMDSLAAIAVAGAEDVDGDTLPDALIGAAGNNDAGVDAGAAFLVPSSILR